MRTARCFACSMIGCFVCVAACDSRECESEVDDTASIDVTLTNVPADAVPTFTLDGNVVSSECFSYGSTSDEAGPPVGAPPGASVCSTWSLTPATSGTIVVTVSGEAAQSFSVTVTPSGDSCNPSPTVAPRAVSLAMTATQN